jgi:deoxyribodipyrimidine photolyase
MKKNAPLQRYSNSYHFNSCCIQYGSTHLQKGGRIEGLRLLNSFLYERGEGYTKEMSSPVTAFKSCSRLSVHFAFGTVSIREVFQVKQGIDHDPEGVFIRHWIPELREMDQTFIHTPWQAVSQMNGYPMPIVDEKTARKFAADKVYGLRKNNATHKETAEKIVNKHGSRKSSLPKTVSKKRSANNTGQRELPL